MNIGSRGRRQHGLMGGRWSNLTLLWSDMIYPSTNLRRPVQIIFVLKWALVLVILQVIEHLKMINIIHEQQSQRRPTSWNTQVFSVKWSASFSFQSSPHNFAFAETSSYFHPWWKKNKAVTSKKVCGGEGGGDNNVIIHHLILCYVLVPDCLFSAEAVFVLK